ncbi:hypothetical protein HI914_06413 [Erysiphe necator]|nr:hypothetical protein HI914_06413 [Erysiphe necator]
MRVNIFMTACLSLLPAIFASHDTNPPGIRFYRPRSDHSSRVEAPRELNNPDILLRNTNELISELPIRKSPPSNGVENKNNDNNGYSCRCTLYSLAYLKKVAAYAKKRLYQNNRQPYPVEFEPRLYTYMYPLHENRRSIWLKGNPEPRDFVVFNAIGQALYAVTAGSPTSKKSHHQCWKVSEILPHCSPSRFEKLKPNKSLTSPFSAIRNLFRGRN